MIYDVRRLLRRLRARAWQTARRLPSSPVPDALSAAILVDDAHNPAAEGYRDADLMAEARSLLEERLASPALPDGAFEPLAAAALRCSPTLPPDRRQRLIALGVDALAHANADPILAATWAWWLYRLDGDPRWARQANDTLQRHADLPTDAGYLARAAWVASELACHVALQRVQHRCERYLRQPDGQEPWGVAILLDYVARQTGDGRHVQGAWIHGRLAESRPQPPDPLGGLWTCFLADCLRTPRPSPAARPIRARLRKALTVFR